MAEEFEHIDNLFSKKLKDYQESTSPQAWDKMAAILDAKGKTNVDKKAITWRKWRLLSLVTIGFLLLFSVQDNIELPNENTRANGQILKISPQQNAISNEVISAEYQQENQKEIADKIKESTITSNVKEQVIQVQKISQNSILKKNKTIGQATVANTKASEQKTGVNAVTLTEKIVLTKKPAKMLFKRKETKKRAKGIKVEISLDANDEQNINRPASSPQHKKTIQSIFKKLRRFSENAKKN